jgi:hypothetical protein
LLAARGGLGPVLVARRPPGHAGARRRGRPGGRDPTCRRTRRRAAGGVRHRSRSDGPRARRPTTPAAGGPRGRASQT